MYKVKFAPTFGKSLSKITKRDIPLQEKVRKILRLLESDPKYPALKSHKVQTLNFGERWSSRVTGDIRIIWDFDEEDNIVIFVLDIGGHSGSGKVYK